MAKDWRVEKLRSPEQVFRKINRLRKPTCIVVFGADGGHKDTVFEVFCKQFGEAIHIYDIGSNPIDEAMYDLLKRIVDNRQDIVIKLPGHISCESRERHAFIKRIQETGVASIVGIYAKITLQHHLRVEPGDIATANQAGFLSAVPPTPEDLDYLVTVND
jgi:hypothetical protein